MKRFCPFLLLISGILLLFSGLPAQTLEWVYQHESPYPNAIAVDSAGNTYTTGCIAQGDTNGIGIIALNPAGTLKWFYFNDTLADWVYGNDITMKLNRIYVAGYEQFLDGNKDLIVLCVDTLGNAEWIYRDTAAFEANAVVVSQSHHVYAAGFTRISSLDIIVLKIDSLGNLKWRYVYDGPAGSYDEALDIAIDRNENIYVGGYSTGFGTSTDFTVIKVDSLGSERWRYLSAGPFGLGGMAGQMAVDGLGGVYVSGNLDGFLAVVKLSNSGNEEWVYKDPYALVARDIVADVANNIYITGRKRVSQWNDDIVVMKFASSQGGIKEVVCNETIKRNPKATISRGGIDFLPEENCGLKVYDVTGRMVVEQRFKGGGKKVDIKLQPGVYFLKVEGRKAEIKKIIVL